jgi:hypothetical protein
MIDARRKVDMGSPRIGKRPNGGGFGPFMDAHIGKVGAESGLHLLP